jgi:hypothetical protein
MYAGSETESIAAVSPLFAGDYPVENRAETIASGVGEVADYTVVGRVTASDKIVPCDLDATDGSEVPVGVIVFGGDATSADVGTQMYTSGVFNMDKLVWHTSFDTEAKKLNAFRSGPLFVKKVGPVVP